MAPYHAKKRLGQNFLKSQEIIQKIVEEIDPQVDERIIEIGPGRGAITLALAKSGANITAVEFDRDLCGYLVKLCGEYSKVEIINQDFLTFKPSFSGYKLVGNLPYNITSPVIDWVVQNRADIKGAYFMVQKEMALRLASSPGCKDWSPIAIMTQVYFEIRHLFDIAPKHFSPSPKVTSSVISLKPKKEFDTGEPGKFEKTVRASFKQRRKTLLNNLSSELVQDNELARKIVEDAGLASNCRAEELSLEQFLNLTNHLLRHKIL